MAPRMGPLAGCEQLRAGGSYAAADTPEEFLAFVRSEVEKWGRLGRTAGIKAPQ